MAHTFFDALTRQHHARFAAFGSQLGSRTLTNADLIARNGLDVEPEWISRRSGIEQRSFVAPGETLADMCVGAAQQALTRANISAAEIDTVILTTNSAPVQTPAMAPLIADRLEATNAVAYDVVSGCSGWGVITAQASALIASGQARNVLLIAGELLSEIIDPKDLATAILFADGAGAAVITRSDTPGVGPVVWGSDGGKWDVIKMTRTHTEVRLGSEPDYMQQEGPSVFRWATSTVPQIVRDTLAAARVDIADIAAFIPHQANARIIDTVAKKLGFSESVVVAHDVCSSGNTSAASIPVALDHLMLEHPELSGKLALQMGYGSGLTWAGQVIVLP